jgi:guanine deaminase
VPDPHSESRQALRGAALTFVADPFEVGIEAAMRHEPDAMVIMQAGKITHFGAAADVLPD